MNQTDMRRLDFTLLLIFREVMRTRSTSETARRLHLSQSAVSHALVRLRALFDDDLLVRRGNAMAPTARAQALLPDVLALLELADRALHAGADFDPATARRTFRIAANDYVASLLTPPLLAGLAQEAPGVQVVVQFKVGEAALEGVRRGEIDVALGRFMSVPPPLQARHLWTEDYGVARARPKRGDPGPLTLETYLGLDHVLVSFQGDLRGTVDQALVKLGVERRVQVAVPMFLTAFHLVQHSAMAITAPRRLVAVFADLFELTVDDPPFDIPAFDVAMVTDPLRARDPALRWLMHRVQQAQARAPATTGAAEALPVTGPSASVQHGPAIPVNHLERPP